MNKSARNYKPLVVLSESGVVCDVSISDEKGFNKSLEQGALWHRDSNTGKLLPYGKDTPIKGIEDRGGWYLARTAEIGKETAASGAITEKAPEKDSALGASPNKILSGQESFLDRLFSIVEGRKNNPKEGSYTSYLFSKGRDKIRKKLGEEAVELILAEKREDVVFEAADLLYHLSVLLSERDLSFADICSELEKRSLE